MFVALVGAVLLLRAGSVPAQETGKVPDLVPSDRWDASADDGSATVASPTRDATIFLGCTEGDPSITLMVAVMHPLALNDQFRTVTMAFDGLAPVSQTWFSTKDSFGIADDELAFISTLEGLMHHRNVEFVLSENGEELDRHSFTLNGARDAIGSVVRSCHRNG